MRRTPILVRTLVVLSVGAMITVPVSPAQAQAERISFACDSYQLALDLSEAWSWEAGNTSHGRNGIETLGYSGDDYCRGIETVHGNVNVDPHWGGFPWGTFVYDLEEFDGGFEGTWHPMWGGIVLQEVGTGYGVLEGWQFRAIWEFDPEWEEGDPESHYGWLTGYVFYPGG